MKADDFEVTPRARLPTEHGDFELIGFRFADGQEHVAIVHGRPGSRAVLARAHSSCITGDVLGSRRCDCGPQLDAALDRVVVAGAGVILYLRGIGLFNKVLAYVEQDQGADTIEANHNLGLAADARSYDQAATMLAHLGIRSVRLMTNNPAKVAGLQAAGIDVVERLAHVVGEAPENARYLETKRTLMGHLLRV